MTQETPPHTFLTFPTSFPLKVMGKNVPEFLPLVSGIVSSNLRVDEKVVYTSRVSSNSKYLSITATFMAQSQAQLDAIYLQLKSCELVLMTL